MKRQKELDPAGTLIRLRQSPILAPNNLKRIIRIGFYDPIRFVLVGIYAIKRRAFPQLDYNCSFLLITDERVHRLGGILRVCEMRASPWSTSSRNQEPGPNAALGKLQVSEVLIELHTVHIYIQSGV